MTIGYTVKHNRLSRNRLLFSRCDSMLPEKSVEVDAVDVDFSAYLGEGDKTLVAVVLPCLWRNAKDFTDIFRFYPFLLESSALRRVIRSMICAKASWRFRHSSSGMTKSRVEKLIFTWEIPHISGIHPKHSVP